MLQMIILITKEMTPAILFFDVRVVFTVSIQLAQSAVREERCYFLRGPFDPSKI